MLSDSLTARNVKLADFDDRTKTMNFALSSTQGSNTNVVLTAPATSGILATYPTAMTDAQMLVSDANGIPTAQTISGDLVMTNTGVVTVDSLTDTSVTFEDSDDDTRKMNFELSSLQPTNTTISLVVPSTSDTLATLTNIYDS